MYDAEDASMLGVIWDCEAVLAAAPGSEPPVEVAALLSVLVVAATIEPGSRVEVLVGREVAELLVWLLRRKVTP